MKTIGFIGGGRITRILLKAFTQTDFQAEKIEVFDPNSSVADSLIEYYPSISFRSDNIEPAAACELIFLAIHPPVMLETLNNIKSMVDPVTMVVSLAPKLTIEKISSVLTRNSNIARINPSASSWCRKGVNPVCFASGTDPEKRTQLLELIKPLGITPEVDESKIEAYAMISAMGHTYFWFQLKKLYDLALQFGMDPTEAKNLITLMMEGSLETLFQSELSYEEVVDLVPVKPLGPVEEQIIAYYDEYLIPLYHKIKP